MIFPLPSFVAHLAELAQRAVLNPVGIGRGTVSERREEPGADTAAVGREVRVAQGTPLADAEEDVHQLGCDALDGGDRLRVEAELQHVGWLLGARELGVEGFVAPLPKCRWLIFALQEICAAAPIT